MIFSGNTLEYKNFNILGFPIPGVSYQWYRNGIEIEGATSSSYNLTVDDVNKGISLGVSVSNIYGSNFYVYSLGSTIFPTEGELPRFLSTPTNQTSINPPVGSTASVESYGSTGYAPITTNFTWLSSGLSVGSDQDSYFILESDQGNTLSCLITLTNSVGTTSASVDFGSVGIAPSFITTPTPSTTPVLVNTTVSVENYTSTGTAPITTAFTWLSGGVTVGSNSDTYSVQESDFGNSLVCNINLSNSNGSTQGIVEFGNVQGNWDYQNDGIYRFPTPFTSSYSNVIEVDASTEFSGITQASTLEGDDVFRLKFDSEVSGTFYTAVWDGVTWATYQSWGTTSTEQRFSNLFGNGGTPSENEIFVLYRENPGNPSVWTDYTSTPSGTLNLTYSITHADYND